MSKRSLSSVIKDAVEHHDIVCLDDKEIVLGVIEDFLDDTRSCQNRCRYFIQDGLVLLTVACPGLPHENLSRTLGYTLFGEFSRWAAGSNLPNGSVIAGGSTRTLDLVNTIGCGSVINKEPDESFCLGRPLTGKAASDPFLVLEVASRHESHHLLLCEAAMWLNEHSSAQYVLAVKIWPDNDRMLVYLLRKNVQAAKKVSAQKTQGTCVKSGISGAVPDSVRLVEEEYGFDVVHMYDIRGPISVSDRVMIVIEMAEILAREGIYLAEGTISAVEIDIAPPIRGFLSL